MNLIQEKLKELNELPYRPDNWVKKVMKNLKTKKIKYSESGIRAIFRHEYYNEDVAIEIIKVFNEEIERQEKLLKKL